MPFDLYLPIPPIPRFFLALNVLIKAFVNNHSHFAEFNQLSIERGKASLNFLFPMALKKEFIGPGLHLRPVCADRARPPLQWTLNSVLSACGNGNGRVRPPLWAGGS